MTVSHDYSYVSSSDNAFIDSLYTDYKRNPDSVDLSWKQFFRGVEFALSQPEGSVESTGGAVAPGNRVENVDRICAPVAPVPPTFRVDTPSVEDTNTDTGVLVVELFHITGLVTNPLANAKK